MIFGRDLPVCARAAEATTPSYTLTVRQEKDMISLTINGAKRNLDVVPDMPLLGRCATR